MAGADGRQVPVPAESQPSYRAKKLKMTRHPGPLAGGSAVVTFAVLLEAETLPAASFALTVKAYEVEAVKPVTENEVLAVEPSTTPSL